MPPLHLDPKAAHPAIVRHRPRPGLAFLGRHCWRRASTSWEPRASSALHIEDFHPFPSDVKDVCHSSANSPVLLSKRRQCRPNSTPMPRDRPPHRGRSPQRTEPDSPGQASRPQAPREEADRHTKLSPPRCLVDNMLVKARKSSCESRIFADRIEKVMQLTTCTHTHKGEAYCASTSLLRSQDAQEREGLRHNTFMPANSVILWVQPVARP